MALQRNPKDAVGRPHKRLRRWPHSQSYSLPPSWLQTLVAKTERCRGGRETRVPGREDLPGGKMAGGSKQRPPLRYGRAGTRERTRSNAACTAPHTAICRKELALFPMRPCSQNDSAWADRRPCKAAAN